MTQFSIKRDIEIGSSGGFWCSGCLVGKPADEQSDDPRYCHSCFKFYKEEATFLLDNQKQPTWKDAPVPIECLPAVEKAVTKLSDHDNIYAEVKEGIMLQKNKVGRPKKPEGESVTRMTKWRREKGKQGRLVF